MRCPMLRTALVRTFCALKLDKIGQFIDSGKENLDVADETLRYKDAFDVRAIANVEEHIRNARS